MSNMIISLGAGPVIVDLTPFKTTTYATNCGLSYTFTLVDPLTGLPKTPVPTFLSVSGNNLLGASSDSSVIGSYNFILRIDLDPFDRVDSNIFQVNIGCSLLPLECPTAVQLVSISITPQPFLIPFSQVESCGTLAVLSATCVSNCATPNVIPATMPAWLSFASNSATGGTI